MGLYCKGENILRMIRLVTFYQNARLRWLCCILLNFVFRFLAGQSKNRELSTITRYYSTLYSSSKSNEMSHQRLTESPMCNHFLTRSWGVATRSQGNSIKDLSQKKVMNSDYKWSRKCHLVAFEGNAHMYFLKWRAGILFSEFMTFLLGCLSYK